MNPKTERIRTSDGIELHLNAWETPDAIADIVFCHGFQEHSGRYTEEAAFFNHNKINFLGFDMRGHGLSDGRPKSYIADFNQLVSDFNQVFNHYQSDRPAFIFGHSLGGLVISSFLVSRPDAQKHIKGLMLSAPLLMPNGDMAPILQKVSPFISSLLPKLKTVKLDPHELSRDHGVVDRYINDPLVCHSGIHARTGDVLLRQMKSLRSKLDKINLPMIIQHSKIDKLTEHEGSRLLFDESSSDDKIFISLDEYRHEITRDVGREQILDDYLDWLTQRI